MSDSETRTAYWFSCEDDECGAAMVVYPHSFAGHDLPEDEDWETEPFYINCPVCGEGMDWGGTDPASEIIRNY